MTHNLSLTGVWHGLYSYLAPASPIHFVATVISSGTFVSGSTHEAVTGSRGAPLTVFAGLEGVYAGKAVSFRKIYDGTGGWTHHVDYEGMLNADATEIEGRWTLPAGWQGRFLMIRSRGATEEVARKIYARMD
jgi:hypothetical protein